jgi:hypothetical protein
MFKLKAEHVLIGVQGQRDNVAEGGMPSDGPVSRFVVFVCDDVSLLLPDSLHKLSGVTGKNAWVK